LKIKAILLHAKGAGVLTAADNSRSISWHDTLTNRRGRILEEFLVSRYTYSTRATTLPSRVVVALATLISFISNQLLSTVVKWEISEQESRYDHIIRNVIGQSADHRTATDDQELRHVVKRIIKRISIENSVSGEALRDK
jgi:hypothetical protein